ncbi:MAG: hypothetical protein NT136_03780 [Candidatus Moranbacteria bacterium]|nr:hypothetical protein [Candidatus Moranbacteria bacterium]
MRRRSKIILGFFIILFLAVSYWAYKVVRVRYFPSPTVVEEKSAIPQAEVQKNTEGEKTSPDGTTESPSMEKEKASSENGEALPQIDSEDCDNECAGFEGKNLDYCRQVCGFTEIKKITDDCQNTNGLEKDYCLKDMAVTKMDFKICDEIKNATVKETCKNRITEEILDEDSNKNELETE